MKNTKKKGFTIIELVIVIAIVAILAAVLIPTFASLVKKATETKAETEAKNLITEMLSDILSDNKEAPDLLVFSHNGEDVYLYGYDSSEGRLLTYGELEEKFTDGDFKTFVDNLLKSDVISVVEDTTITQDDWRHPDNTAKIVENLDSKGEMVVYANYRIEAGVLAKQTSVTDVKGLTEAFSHAKAGEDVYVSLRSDVVIEDNAFNVMNGGTEVGDIYINANGNTITNNNSDSVRGLQIANTTVKRTVTITNANLKITGTETAYNAKENRGVQLYGLENATINLVNCNVEMSATDYSYPVKIINSKNLTINITDCTLTGANCIETNGADSCTFNITNCIFNSNYQPHATYCGNGIQDKNGTNNTFNIKNTTFNGSNAQPWQTSATTTINDLGGNVDNTTRTTE